MAEHGQARATSSCASRTAPRTTQARHDLAYYSQCHSVVMLCLMVTSEAAEVSCLSPGKQRAAQLRVSLQKAAEAVGLFASKAVFLFGVRFAVEPSGFLNETLRFSQRVANTEWRTKERARNPPSLPGLNCPRPRGHLFTETRRCS